METNPRDIRPSVAGGASKLSVPMFLAVLAAAGGGLFYALQIHRLDQTGKPLAEAQDSSGVLITSPAPLAIPPSTPVEQRPYLAQPTRDLELYYPGTPVLLRSQAPATQQGPARPFKPSPVDPPQPSYIPEFPRGPFAPAPSQSGVVFQAPPLSPTAPATGTQSQAGDTRVKASTLSNPSTTVPQGSVIHAVMETALDSTRPGFARAIVSQDVLSFDGSRVLVPKGSKLFGEYKADLSLGEKRALIQWHRLTRPDGAIIDVNSPAADPLGRAGLKGKVNTHFFERFGGVILQSVLDLGVRAATTRASRNTVILGAPPAVQGAIVQQPGEIRPTLKARQGSSVTVFVGRDLDFSAVE